MTDRPSGTSARLAVTVALLMVCVAGTASAAPVSGTASVAGSPWAYGVVRTITVQGANLSGDYAYRGSAVYGFSAILNESVPVANVSTVSVERTMGVLLTIEYCVPNCRSPILTATLNYHAWETTYAHANLTTAAAVHEGSTSVPALGLVNSSASVSAGIRESAVYGTRTTVLLAKALSLNASGSAAVQLTPALGLVPLNLTAGTSWNASSVFHATGAYNWTLNASKSGRSINSTWTNLSGNGSVNRSGNVSLSGNYTAGSTVEFGGTTYAAVDLSVQGPFAVREGFILLPSGADLFGGGKTSWSSDQLGSATVTDTHLDLGAHFATGRLGLAASGSLWRSSTTNPAAWVGGSNGTVLAPAAPSADGPTPTFVQAQPESVSQAQSNQQCLATGLGCPGSPSGPRGVFGLVVIAGVGIVAIAIVAGTYNRRRLPPAVYPNAGLYPPGTPIAPAAARPTAPPPPPRPTEDDPLGHLW